MSADPLPLVSIVLPVLNGERHLCASLDSILAQSHPRLEVLVIDDGSSDRTPDLIAAYGTRVAAIRLPVNQGQFRAVNCGIQAARGELIGVLHADDVYLPTMIERQVAFLDRHPGVGAVFCKDVFIDADGREFGRLDLPRELAGRAVLDFPTIVESMLRHKNRVLRTPSALVRRSVYCDVGLFDPSFGIAADLEMWCRIARRYPIGLLDEHLFCYRTGHDHASARHYRLRTEPERHFEILDRILREGSAGPLPPDALEAHEAHRAEDQLMLAINHYIRSERAAARRRLEAMRVQPILASRSVQRARLLVLYLMMRVLVGLPRASLLAGVFYRRWHAHGR